MPALLGTSGRSGFPVLGSRDRLIPSVAQQTRLRRRHLRGEAAIFGRGGVIEIGFPETDRQSSQIGSSERRGFGHGGANDRDSENVRLKLHEAVVGSGSAV